MDDKSDEQFLIVQAKNDANKQDTNEKQMNTDEKISQITEDLKILTETITSMMDHTNN